MSDVARPQPCAQWKARHSAKPWFRFLLLVERGMRWLNYCLRSSALFDLLELAGRTTVLAAAVLWLWECENRTKAKHYRAWELINSARGSRADGGRRDALQDLNEDGESLVAAPLEEAYLQEVRLNRADLRDAELKKADLIGAKLAEASLQGAKLMEAHLSGADLTGAKLHNADLTDAHLNSILIKQRPQDQEIKGANLTGAVLSGTILGKADFADVILSRTEISYVDLSNVKNLTQEQINQANGVTLYVTLPEGLYAPAHWLMDDDPFYEGHPLYQPED